MFHNEFLQARGQPVEMTPGKFPESPSDVGQPEMKQNPALFALTLSEHAGFDALAARTLTPPPRYTRVEHPRLTLQIPEDVQQDEESTSLSSIESSRETITTESVATSPVATLSVPTSPAALSPSKQPESRLFFKVKAEVKRRGKGIRSKLRKSTSRSGSTSTTPLQRSPGSPSEQPDAAFAYASSNDVSPTSHALPQSFSAVQELDSREINSVSGTATTQVHPAGNGGFFSHLFPRATDSDQSLRRATSVSSIVPTPRRGLTIVAPEGRRPPTASLNPMELTGRLESLSEQDSSQQDVIVSPCSPVSPSSPSNFRPSSLIRSNAIIDRMYDMPDPVSPLPALPGSSPPPSSPTLDGRLERLPRLSVPQSPVVHSQNSHQNSTRNNAYQPTAVPRQFAELDYGKELVNVESSEPEVLGGWYTSPSESHRVNNQQRGAIDHAANAPEVAAHHQASGFDFNGSLNSNHRAVSSVRYTGRPFQPTSPLAALAGTAWESLLSGIIKTTELLRNSYGPDPPVPANHVRVRWKCVCRFPSNIH
jgi:hypothetical protein